MTPQTRPSNLTVGRLFAGLLVAVFLASYGSIAVVLGFELAGRSLVNAPLWMALSPSLVVTAPLAGLIYGAPGLAVVAPVWLLLHRLRRATALAATIAGALTPLPVLAWYGFGPTVISYELPLWPLLMTVGGLSGLACRAVAYSGAEPAKPCRQADFSGID